MSAASPPRSGRSADPCWSAARAGVVRGARTRTTAIPSAEIRRRPSRVTTAALGRSRAGCVMCPTLKPYLLGSGFNVSEIDAHARYREQPSSLSVTATAPRRRPSTGSPRSWSAAVLPLAWIGASLARDAPNKGTYFVLHKSVGLTILALVVARILWRMVRPAPPDPNTPAGLTLIARISHWLLYAVFLVMPVTGYLLSAFGGRGTPYFWLVNIPGPDQGREPAQPLRAYPPHRPMGGLRPRDPAHCGNDLAHRVRRDGVHERMLPAQRLREPAGS